MYATFFLLLVHESNYVTVLMRSDIICQGLMVVPLWDANSRQMAGMLTASDFILILLQVLLSGDYQLLKFSKLLLEMNSPPNYTFNSNQDSKIIVSFSRNAQTHLCSFIEIPRCSPMKSMKYRQFLHGKHGSFNTIER